MAHSCPRTLGVVTLAALTAASGGCTVVGLAVGSSMDRYRDVSRQAAPPAACERERAVLLRAPAAPGRAVRAGARAPQRQLEVIARTPTGVVVQEHGVARPLAWSQVAHTQCRVGTYALHGAAFGALADGVVLLGWLVYEISQADVGGTKF